MKQVHVRVDDELYNELNMYSIRNELTMQDCVREAVAYLRATKLSRGLTAREYKTYAGYKRELAIAEKEKMEASKKLELKKAN